MVEGPGCTLNGEKIRARVQKGQKVKEIRGSLTASTKTNPGTNIFLSFHGCLYSGVETLGKELFMYFGLKALRVHFGMNGSMRVNPAERTPGSPSLEIHLSRDVVCFYDITAESRLSEDCQRRVNATRDLDVCSPGFSCSRSEAAVRQRGGGRGGGAMLCDVLLDQTVMPGVGNIIKNEALFDSGLHPAVKVEQLTDEQIRHVVKMTRDFTLLFYKCRKSGSALYKHYRVYKRPQCGRCSHVVTVCRLGENGRMTYFCSRCQSSDPSRVDTSQLPSRNLLLPQTFSSSLREDVAQKEEEDWTCPRCTLINPPPAATCDACLSPRPPVSKDNDGGEAASSFTSGLIKYQCNAFKKPSRELKVNWRSAFGTSTLVFSDLSDNPVNPPLPPAAEREEQRALHKQGTATSPNYASGGWQRRGEHSDGESLASYSQPSKKMRIDHSPFGSNGAGKAAAASLGMHKIEAKEAANAPPCCASHRRPATLRVVHKDGENKGRRFYGCSMPRETKCNFFEWADLHFPLCHHGRRCVMRTVLKLGPNNGRCFYTCSSQKGKQCEFFQWAASGDENVI